MLFDGAVLKHFGHGVSINKWEDLTVNAKHLIQNTAAAQPVARLLNGLWCAQFDGVDDFMDAAGFWNNGTDWTAFILQQTSGDNIMVADSGGLNSQMRIGQGANNISMFDGGNNPQSSAMWIPRTDWSVVAYGQVPGANTPRFMQSGKEFTSGGTLNNTVGWNRLGTASGGGAAFTNGYIAYYLHYPYLLTHGQFDYVMRGLCAKATLLFGVA